MILSFLSASLPAACADIIARIDAAGLRLAVERMPSDIGLPLVRATIIDPAFPTAHGPDLRWFPGLGCDPSAEIALTRALSEAAQSRLAIIQGARDSFNRQPLNRRTSASLDRARAYFRTVRRSRPVRRATSA